MRPPEFTMETDFARNPALSKLRLFCEGMRIDPGCTTLDADGRPIMRTRAGLGSGLDLILPGGMWVNVPVVEPFARRSAFTLVRTPDGYAIRTADGVAIPVTIPPAPAFYRHTTSNGTTMSRVGILQGTYLAVYPTGLCAHWTRSPATNCAFCSVGLNLGTQEEETKRVRDVVETALAARAECGITYVHFNTGYYDDDIFLDELEPFVEAVAKETGLLIGVQTPPHHDFSRYDRLRKMGVNQVSFCFEFWDPEVFTRLCPGKAEKVGLQRYLDAITYCAPIFDTTNGEIIAGVEPVERTIEAIEWITDQGAIPTVCVFRPLVGTAMADYPPPRAEELIPVFARLYDACVAKGLPIGIAPNIEVSIILKPEECRSLSDAPPRPLRDAKAFVMRQTLKGLIAVRTARARLHRTLHRRRIKAPS